MLNESMKLQRHPDVHSREFEGETVMMDESLMHYFGLNQIGTRVWELLEQPVTLATICQILTQEFDVSESQCHADVSPFLNQLLENNIIIQHDAN